MFTRYVHGERHFSIVRYPLLLSQSVWFLLYLAQMSPRTSDWKSQGETKTMSPTRTQTLLFNLPRTLHNRSLPSSHFTIILSKPSIRTAMPSTSLAAGNWIFPKLLSLTTFRLPISSHVFPETGVAASVSIRKTMFFWGLV